MDRDADHYQNCGAAAKRINHLSTIRNVDHIFVLDGGRITEQGTHAQLPARNGAYAGLWRLQTGTAHARHAQTPHRDTNQAAIAVFPA